MARLEKTHALPLLGGGVHGAFSWGALDRLLEDERIEIDGISGTSAGSMNAVVLADGLMAESSARDLVQINPSRRKALPTTVAVHSRPPGRDDLQQQPPKQKKNRHQLCQVGGDFAGALLVSASLFGCATELAAKQHQQAC